MTEDVILRFGEQFDWQGHIENAGNLKKHEYFIVCGMGGSNLSTWLIRKYGNKRSSLIFHRDYGLPMRSDEYLKGALIILSSYSGNTEEVLDSARVAIEKGLSVAVLTTGGALLQLAREHGWPYVQMPEMGLEPRMAIGLSMLGVARLMEDAELEEAIRVGGKAINPGLIREGAVRMAQDLQGKVPVIYASEANAPLAYIWKIKFNENAKIPAFCNEFPEACHNEISGFGVVDATRNLSSSMHVIFLDDDTDHVRTQKRALVASEILRERGIPVTHIDLLGDVPPMGRQGFEKAFYTAILADWVSFELARHYGVPFAETPLVVDFKRRMIE